MVDQVQSGDLKELREVIKLVASGSKAYAQASQDGKIDLNDLGFLLPVFADVGPAFDKAGLVPGELSHATAEQIKQEALALLGASGIQIDAKTMVYVGGVLNILVEIYKMSQVA